MDEKTFYAFLDTLQKTAAQAGDAFAGAAYLAGKQADSFYAAAKANVKVLKLHNRVRDALNEVGEMVYDTHASGSDHSDTLMDKLQEIDRLKAEITALEVQAGKAAFVRICPVCGTEAKDGDAYCRACGQKL